MFEPSKTRRPGGGRWTRRGPGLVVRPYSGAAGEAQTSSREREGHVLFRKKVRVPFFRELLHRLAEPRREFGAVADLRRRGLERRPDRLRPAAEALGEEILGDRVEGDVVLGAGEAVAFVGEDDVGHRDVLRLERVDDLLAL